MRVLSRVAELGEEVAHARLNEEPGALILGLLLDPLDLGVAVALE